jgi:predicted negative regulator of RcsB-dependent stress response
VYVIKTTQEYKSIQKSNSIQFRKYIIINPLDSNSNLATTIKYLKKGNYDGARKYLANSNNNKTNEYLFSMILLDLFKKSFSDAINLLPEIDETSDKCLKYLLYADCLSERAKDASIQEIIDEYQKALDCDYSDVNKEIINIRIKLLKFNY